MAGGSGTRFWPQSRRRHAQAVPCRRRPAHAAAGDGAAPARRRAAEHLYVVAPRELAAAGAPPAARPAAAQPAHRARGARYRALSGVGRRRGSRGTIRARSMAVFPADHVIRDVAGFRRCVAARLRVAEARGPALVTFGIRRRAPETGYGYVEIGSRCPTAGGRQPRGGLPVVRFVEKPERRAARAVRRFATASLERGDVRLARRGVARPRWRGTRRTRTGDGAGAARRRRVRGARYRAPAQRCRSTPR